MWGQQIVMLYLMILPTSILLFGVILFWFLKTNQLRLLYLDLTRFLPEWWHPENVGDYYDKWAGEYQKYYGNVIQAYRPEKEEDLYEYYIRSMAIKKGMKLLDAGCGICGPSIYFANKLNVEIEAITISATQVASAQKRIIEDNILNLKVRQGDYHLLDKIYRPEYFDVVYFLESFGHATNQRKVLVAASQVIKRKGYIYIKDFFRREMQPSLCENRLIRLGLRNMRKIYLFNAADLHFTIYILGHLGFELIFIRKPEFVWDGRKAANAFEAAHNIDLFETRKLVDIVYPYELLFQKV
jgi:ubiquinone/menaquinone biosynthesis C-methylase UbiE